MTTTLYGIKNCDTVRKARKWLDSNQIPYQFHDFREDGITSQLISQWLESVDWSELFNKRSTTFRQLSDAQKSNLNEQSALQLMQEHPTLIKRPVLNTAESTLIGFKPDTYQAAFKE